MENGNTIFNHSATEKGITTGGSRRCGWEGCGSDRVAVRWPDGRITHQCGAGLTLGPVVGTYKIR
jgi:hypothetical protein